MTPLRQRMLGAMQLRGMAARTQEAYIEAVARLAQHHRCSPDALNAHQVQTYLLHLLNERKLSRSTVNQYGCAFRFLYIQVLERDRGVFQIPLAPAPQRLPEILSRQEIAELIAAAKHPRARTRRAMVKLPKVPGAKKTTWPSCKCGAMAWAMSSWAMAGVGSTISSAPRRATPMSALTLATVAVIGAVTWWTQFRKRPAISTNAPPSFR